VEIRSWLKKLHAARCATWVVAVGFFCLSLALYTRHNNFPFAYHPDEPTKVAQLNAGTRNFNHPLLLLSATDSTMRALKISRTMQNAAVVGRWIAAACAAGAVAILALLAHHYRGPLAATVAGASVMLHGKLFLYSHYMKEDTALVLGIVLTFLAMACYWSKPTLARAALLGMACAVAISSKYAGAMMPVLALPVLFFATRMGAFLNRLLIFAAVFLALTISINYKLVAQKVEFEKSLDREVRWVSSGHFGIGEKVPHLKYVNEMRKNSGLFTWLLMGSFAAGFIRQRAGLPGWMLLFFPYVYMAVLSFLPKTSDRYLLPTYVLVAFQAGMGIEFLCSWTASLFPKMRSARIPVAAGLLVAALLPQVRSLRNLDRAFQGDARIELAHWIQKHLPPDAVIAQGKNVRLSDPGTLSYDGPQLRQRIISKFLLSDFGELDELRNSGITHVAISKSEYGAYLSERQVQPALADDYRRRKEFYERLRSEGILLWKKKGGPTYLNPHLELFQLPLNKREPLPNPPAQ
jgi:hypothetical protein